MKTKFRILALLLVLVMLFTSCNLGETPDTPQTDGPVQYTVTFETNGGTVVEPLLVEEGGYATKPDNPTKEGFKFVNWYTEPELTNIWSTFNPITSNITVYAKWSKVEAVTPDPADPKFVREDNSVTREELLERYTLTQEEFEATLALLDEMVSISKTASTVDEVDAIYDEFETAFYHLAQQMTLASIVYYCDMSDEEAEKRHTDTTDMFYDVQDKYTTSCRTMYLESPYSAELFADWSEDEIQELLDYDPRTVELKKEIENIQTEYNGLSGDDYDNKVVNCYIRLIKAGNELAALYGYDNYYEYSTARVYGRDYTTEELALYRTFVKEYISPNLSPVTGTASSKASRLGKSDKNLYSSIVNGKFDSMNKNYVVRYLDSLGDTVMGNSMRDVFESENCVFTSSGNSHPSAFQTYLYEDKTPFCLFGVNGQTSNTLVHEIGHYYAAKVNDDINNYDLCETHSQGNEFLFINFLKGEVSSKLYKVLALENIGSAYDIIVRAAIVDEFEQKVYEYENPDELTPAILDQMMNEVAASYPGGGAVLNNNGNMCQYWRMVCIDNPVYYISYSVSAVAALNVFALVESDKEAGYAAYTSLVEGENIDEKGFVEALDFAGFTTPFEEDTFIAIKAFVDELLK